MDYRQNLYIEKSKWDFILDQDTSTRDNIG